jgi:DNA polymerase-1
MLIVLSEEDHATVATFCADDGTIKATEAVSDLASFVATHERSAPRWVWDDTSHWYPHLLAARVRVDRCYDLRLCHAILRGSELTEGSALATARPSAWDEPRLAVRPPVEALFELDVDLGVAPPDPVEELVAQRAAVAASANPARIDRLLAAESVGALIGAELEYVGLPWSRNRHEELLAEYLGARPADGERPPVLEEILGRVRELLGVRDLNPDSPMDLLRALRSVGLPITSTRSWELKELDHPAIGPLLEYKKLARLHSSNGWAWLDTWVADGRFRPGYIPGGVVTGRWAARGGGALQLPRQVRSASVADPGWKLVVADAAQLEPRILAALAGDRRMAEAGAAGDLYAGIVASGAVETRAQAKIALLGAMYGATTGESGRLLPRLQRAYPQAIGLVEAAARAGERGEVVTTRLGRSSPPGQAPGYDETASESDVSRARSAARSRGRFTRNFIVQGTAAEWALCWMASIRRRLLGLAGGAWLPDAAHLVFFLHDEIVVHSPAELADRVGEELRHAAADAGRLLFGDLPVDFPVTVAIVDNYGQAK